MIQHITFICAASLPLAEIRAALTLYALLLVLANDIGKNMKSETKGGKGFSTCHKIYST
ncbi:hypothetical protein M011DRAFT_467868 [Sporormia fimetaria CBS 119925]|uniref:Uncharacterized protein n=1 Tax=Sporormia fimetaria CBS 119925 TaxID=1340428 RepID=A0A6A6V9Q5_9PLEO|nr:hypothetical protein M011DRAFT_467868 [Sporormia fimetaria CBS 119925]